MAALMAGNAIAFGVCGAGLRARPKPFYWVTLALLAVNIALTFADQLGLLDWTVLAIYVVTLALLLRTERRAGWVVRRGTNAREVHR